MPEMTEVAALLANAEADNEHGLVIGGATLDAFSFDALLAIRNEGLALADKMNVILVAIRAELADRMAAAKEVTHFHPDLTITYKSPGNEDATVDAEPLYNALHDMVDANQADRELVDKAVSFERVPTFKTNLTYINMLEKQGGAIAALVQKHVIRGNPKAAVIKIDAKTPKPAWKIPKPEAVRTLPPSGSV